MYSDMRWITFFVCLMMVWFLVSTTSTGAETLEFCVTISSSSSPTQNELDDDQIKDAIARRNTGRYEIRWCQSPEAISSQQQNGCRFFLIAIESDRIVIERKNGNGKPTPVTWLTIDGQESPFDIAQALSLKLMLAIERVADAESHLAPASGRTTSTSQSSNTAQQKERVIPAETTAPQTPASLPRPEEAVSIPDQSQPNESTPTNESLPPLVSPQMGASAQPIYFIDTSSTPYHLHVSTSYMTGFTKTANAIGVDFGFAYQVYEPIALRLDLGIYPSFENTKWKTSKTYSTSMAVSMHFMLLPISLGIGYLNSFDDWYVGVYGNLQLMQAWIWSKTDNLDGTLSAFNVGFSMTFESGYNFEDWLSFGFFLRPSILPGGMHKHVVERFVVYPEEVSTMGEVQTVTDDVPVFWLPVVQLNLGATVTFHF